MKPELEVCIDNLESLHLAIEGGADRIELCSSLALGGLTPSFGFMKKAAKLSSVPVYAMIRLRQGDFIFGQEDIECMLEDIEAASIAGLTGVVLGVTNTDGSLDLNAMERLTQKAKGLNLGMTLHRAIDVSPDYTLTLQQAIELGFERVLTSGLAPTAEHGIDVLEDMVKFAKGRIDIMAGAGVNAENASLLLQSSKVNALHLSGKTTRDSLMNKTSEAKMGNQDIDDYLIPVTSSDKIRAVKTIILKHI
ncbi:copper homeostasis protein CutC [Vibrio sp. D404a]|uniref:copper homeostasis protein CutC n=1 Tax=unclassified Vibrio TaxID=2614977 RepID=UPI00255668A2|nr:MULTISPECIES: copper homeostasis protein CutC [unclassified Vibrio]MDK9736204.1 copper homeostasis protein CutC [Vibrio sp. D404a]MDK9797299.1 copper homeostasis protein CutC [Vibrio sp. D449a]